MKILITGSTGFIGKKLATRLFQQGHSLVVLARDPNRAKTQIPVPCSIHKWNYHEAVPASVVDSIDAVIHLAGEPIAEKRWSPDQKKVILESRTLGTRHILEAISRAPGAQPKTFISASAIGYFGDRGDEILNEESAPGKGFLAEVCQDWESEIFSDKHSTHNLRRIALRIGIVLGREGGVLSKLLPLYRTGLGGRVGSGKQWMSWIHIDDLVNLITHALSDTSLQGPINAVAPHPVTQSQFSKILGTSLKRPSLFPVPATALRVALGEMSALVLTSQRVTSQALGRSSFQFQYPTLESALRELSTSGHDEEFEVVQFIPKPTSEVFHFFSQAENLEVLTPEWLNFKILKKSSPEIQENMLIDYKLKLHGIPMGWRTKIENWEPNQRFVDTQLKGPYSKWHHTHLFESVPGGTLVKDRVLYRLPVHSISGWLVGPWIRKDIEKIFKYRRAKLMEVFENGKA